jgi:thiol-disulfide isomerase/thioredoxin
MVAEDSYKQALIVAALLAAATFSFSYFFFKVPQKPADSNFGKQFSLVLGSYEGTDVHLYEYRRQLLVAYAWASWCTYCAEELKRLAELKKTYGDKIHILAVNRAEPVPIAKEFTRQLGLGDQIELLLDPTDSFFKSIGGYAMPETVFINEAGDIVFHQRGPLDMPSLEARMKELVQ